VHAVRGPHIEGEPCPGLYKPSAATRALAAKPERRRNRNSSSPPPPSSSTAAARVRARQGAPPGLFKVAAAPWTSYPSRLSQPAILRAAGNRNPRRRFRFPPPAPPRHQGAHPGTRKEVRDPPASLVFVPVHCAVRFSSPEFLAAPPRRLSAPPRRRRFRRHRSLRLLTRCP
jgi:hypothetical protein